MNYYETLPEKSRRYRARRRKLAMLKLADGGPIRCAICGCPHDEIMHIGHPEHRGGRWHRKMDGKMIPWILNTPIEEVRERVQLECPYCNAWHNKFKVYPPENKRPSWLDSLREPSLNGDGEN